MTASALAQVERTAKFMATRGARHQVATIQRHGANPRYSFLQPEDGSAAGQYYRARLQGLQLWREGGSEGGFDVGQGAVDEAIERVVRGDEAEMEGGSGGCLRSKTHIFVLGHPTSLGAVLEIC